MPRRLDNFPILRIAAMLAVAATGVTVPAEEAPRDDWQPYFRSLAQEYQIAPTASPEDVLALHEKPVLRWSQPVRGGDDGAVYVWLDDGRPGVIGTMFCWPHAQGYRVVVNEFHSLMTQPLTAKRGENMPWAPETGIEFQDFKKTDAPAKTAPQRLIQMRRLAERFRGENIDDRSDQKWELRLLPTPLMRFDRSDKSLATEGDVLDGALMALVSGTDPEILILIEARTTPAGPKWQWSLARFSDRPLKAWLDDKEIWSVERARPSKEKIHTFFDVAKLTAPPEADEASSKSPPSNAN
jgi:hypothetical protein